MVSATSQDTSEHYYHLANIPNPSPSTRNSSKKIFPAYICTASPQEKSRLVFRSSSASYEPCWHNQVLVFLQKHRLFLWNLALRSDLIVAMPCPALVVQASECGLATFRHLVELLTGKVKHFSYSFSLQEGSRTEQRILGEGRGKKLYQQSSRFILIPRTKKY